MRLRIWTTSALLSSLVIVSLLGLSSDQPSVNAADAVEAKPEPVEKSMHEFMEYVFQPTYKRLRKGMATEPADRTAWKAIKSDSLILAEGANLLLFRQPKEKSDQWVSASLAVRDLGGKFYRAAAKSDYAMARGHYAAMLKNCNQCHKVFAKGKYQLVP